MRSIAARGRLQPLIFDRSVLAQAPTTWSYANEGAIGRWILA